MLVLMLVIVVVVMRSKGLGKAGEVLHAHLREDVGEEVLEVLVLAVARDGEGVGLDGAEDAGVHKVEDVAVGAKEVRLLDAVERTEARKSTEGLGQLVVGRRGGLADDLLLSADGTLATSADFRGKTRKCCFGRHIGL